MKELLREKGFLAAMAVSFLGFAMGFPFYQVEFPLGSGSFIQFYQASLESQVTLFLIPIAAVLPPGGSYVRESASGFLKLYLSRVSRMDYIRAKTCLVYAGGFLPFFLAGTLSFLFCFFFLYPLELKGAVSWEEARGAVETLLRISFIGGITAEFSGIFAAVFRNYYMAYGLPFVVYYMMVILKERYFPKMYVMYPGEWVLCKESWGTGNAGIWVFFLVVSLAVMLSHSLILYWRLQEV